jgi:hypothetical protein
MKQGVKAVMVINLTKTLNKKRPKEPSYHQGITMATPLVTELTSLLKPRLLPDTLNQLAKNLTLANSNHSTLGSQSLAGRLLPGTNTFLRILNESKYSPNTPD